MSLSVKDCSEHIKRSLGASPSADPLGYINDAGEFLASIQQWSWLEGRSAVLDMVANQSYTDLPKGIREITGYDATSGLLNSLQLTDVATLLGMRSNDITISTWNWYGAVTHKLSSPPNSVRHSNNFGGTSWADAGTPPTLATGKADPLGGTSATMFTVTALADIRKQVVPYGDITAGVNCVSIYVQKGSSNDPILEVRDAKTAGVLMVKMAVTFGTVATVATTGDTTFTATIEPVQDGWYRIKCGFTYTTATHGEDGVQLQLIGGTSGTTKFFGAQINEGNVANELTIVSGDILPEGGEPEPILEIWPTPTVDSAGALTIFYRSGWSRVSDDNDLIRVPEWIEPLYKSILRAFARGQEEEDEGTVEARLQSVVQGAIMASCVSRDSRIQPNVGPMRSTAVNVSGSAPAQMLRTEVTGPS